MSPVTHAKNGRHKWRGKRTALEHLMQGSSGSFASIGYDRELWVTRDRVEPNASPVKSTMAPEAEVVQSISGSAIVMADKWRCPRCDPSSETGASNHPLRLVLFFAAASSSCPSR